MKRLKYTEDRTVGYVTSPQGERSPNIWKNISANMRIANKTLAETRAALKALRQEPDCHTDSSVAQEYKDDIQLWKK